MRYFLFALVLGLSLMPVAAHAAFDFVQIVPDICDCAGTAPAYGCVLQVLQNVIRVAIALGFVLATLALAYAGFTWMTSGSNAERRTQGKNLLVNVFVGLAVMLGAWLLVDFVMKSLYNEGSFGPWNNILAPTGNASARCLQTTQQRAITEGTVDLSLPDVTGSDGSMGGPQGDARRQGSVTLSGGCSGSGAGGSCVSLRPEVSCEASGCLVDRGLKAALAAIPDRVGTNSIGWTVTEGYPPSRTHRAACHQNGTCVDVGLRPRTYSLENIAAFFNAARAQGLSPVLETRDCNLAAQVRQNGGQALCGNWDTHFSVYGR